MRDRSECRQDKERFGTVFCPEGTAGFSPGFQPREMSTHGDKAHMEATTPTSERRNRISEHPIVSSDQWIPRPRRAREHSSLLLRLEPGVGLSLSAVWFSNHWLCTTIRPPGLTRRYIFRSARTRSSKCITPIRFPTSAAKPQRAGFSRGPPWSRWKRLALPFRIHSQTTL